MPATFNPDPTLSALLAEADRAQLHVRIVQDKLAAYLVACGRLPAAFSEAWPATPDHPDLITIPAAAARACRDADTVRRWCSADGIGKKYGGRWRVSQRRLADLIAERQD